MQYVIGVDAGGTKTTAAACLPDGTKLAEEKGAFGNVTVDFDAAGTKKMFAAFAKLKKV